MGTNVVILIGKLIEVLEHELVIQITGEEDLVPISVGQNIIDAVKAYNIDATKAYDQIGNIIGVKGKIKTKDSRVIIEANKITFMSRNQSEGGEEDVEQSVP